VLTSIRPARRSSTKREPVTAWRERLVVDDDLEVIARVYPDAGIVVLEELGVRGGASVVSKIEEIALELTALFPETMDAARVVLFQPVNMWTTRPRYMEWCGMARGGDGWTPVFRGEIVSMTGDRTLPS
jgi:hypothetical protein